MVYWAFKANYRAARLHEIIDLTEGTLTVKRVQPSGEEQSWHFHPYWVRLAVEADRQTERLDLKLRSHGRELSFGRFLSNEEKVDFAQALSGALHAVRGGKPA